MTETAASLPVPDPTQAELLLWAAFAKGEALDLQAGDGQDDDPRHTEHWAPGRRVRAAVITALLLGAVEPVAGRVPRLRITGALVEGDIDVRGGSVTCRVEMTSCHFAGRLLLTEARTRTVDLSGSALGSIDVAGAEISGHLILQRCQVSAVSLSLARISGILDLDNARLTNPGQVTLDADRATITGGILCRGGRSAGEIKLPGAHIGGILDLDGAELTSEGRPTLYADGITVAGGILCRDGFRSAGVIRLPGAHISGILDLDGAMLASQDGVTLHADGITVQGSVFCRDGFQSAGEVRLPGARISGILDLHGAELTSQGGTTLHADGITVDGGIFCEGAFRSEGQIRLPGAHIGGQLCLNGARLTSQGGTTLHADGITVAGDILCQEAFQSEGQIRLPGARIGGQLSLSGARLASQGGTALHAERITVGGEVFCRDGFRSLGEVLLAGAQVSGQVSFRGAELSGDDLALSCEALQAESLLLDQVAISGTVDLTAAKVSALQDEPGHWAPRLSLDGFSYESLQPYRQARGSAGRLAWLAREAAGYRPQPYEQLAAYYRRLGHEPEARRVLLAKQRRRRATLGPLGKLAGWLLDGIVGYGYRPGLAFAWLVVLLAAGSSYFAVNRPAPLDPAQHPHFQPVLYTANLLIPLVNLGQSGVWVSSGLAQWAAAALVGLGWLLVTAVVAGVTRVLARV